jgi:hypothetical protein
MADEPKDQPKRKKRKLTQKERAFVKALPKATSQAEAAVVAGYSPKNPDQSAYQALKSVRKKMPDLMDELGLTDTVLIQKYLVPALEAQETKFFADKGIVLDQRDVIAWGPRLQALQLAGKWKGIERDSESDNSGPAGGGFTVRLELTDEGRARGIAATIAARRPGNRLVEVAANGNANAG